MCGICGIYKFSGIQGSVDKDILFKMRDSMFHRGPDDAGIYISPDKVLGLGHRRLSIIDLSSMGRQPMSNAAGSIWVVFNGEIYNHMLLRKELENKGYRYKSQTDTETLLYLYEEYGFNCLYYLEGMFAFAIWDESSQKLFLARDHLGIKPLYYTIVNNQFIFGSEIKAILEHPDICRDLDETALYHFLSFICTPSPMTLFKDIKKLEPATYMVVGKRGIEIKENYWTPIKPSTADNLSENDYIEKIRELLKESIRQRMISDVPFGAFLSGGIDSSLNVALMSRLMRQPVDTFTVGFSDDEAGAFNEFDYARLISDHFNTNHREILVDSGDVFYSLGNFMRHQDDPVAHPVCMPFYFLSKFAKENGVSVIQVGEGSDEIFFGYERFMNTLKTYENRWALYQKVPSSIRKGIYYLNNYRGSMLSLNKQDYFYLHENLRRAAFGEELFWGGYVCITEAEKALLFSQKFKSRNKGLGTFDILRPYFDEISGENSAVDYVQKMTFLEMGLRLPEHLLMRVDRMSMAFSIEVRVPFLDHNLVEFVFNIPSRIKIKKGAKYILKKAAEGIIPDSIIYRKKQGFAGPSSIWLRKYSKELEGILLGSKIHEREIFEKRYLKGLLENFKKDDRVSGELWCLFILFQWYDFWITRKDIASYDTSREDYSV